MSALLLRMLVVGRRQHSKPIEVALDIEEGGAVLILVGDIACKVSHTLFSCNPPIVVVVVVFSH